MFSQTQVQPFLNDARWALGTVNAKRSAISLRLITFPGVVGGEFKAKIESLPPSYRGPVDVTISCTGWETSRHNPKLQSSSPTTYFQEITELEVQGPSLEVHFLIPIEAKGTNEEATWHMRFQFADGSTETFEVPVCRTPESNPEISEVKIAAAGIGLEKQPKREQSSTHIGKTRKPKTYELTESNGELSLRMPSHTSGRASLATGFGWICAIWGTVAALFYWIFEGEIEPVVILGLPTLCFGLLWAFAKFGVSTCKLGKDKLVIRHKLFGIPLPRSANRSDITGFVPICLEKLPGSGGSYVCYVIQAKNKTESDLFLGAALLDQNDSRTLAKKLNEFWELG